MHTRASMLSFPSMPTPTISQSSAMYLVKLQAVISRDFIDVFIHANLLSLNLGGANASVLGLVGAVDVSAEGAVVIAGAVGAAVVDAFFLLGGMGLGFGMLFYII